MRGDDLSKFQPNTFVMPDNTVIDVAPVRGRFKFVAVDGLADQPRPAPGEERGLRCFHHVKPKEYVIARLKTASGLEAFLVPQANGLKCKSFSWSASHQEQIRERRCS